jgi:hypothetical protein
MRRTLIRTTLAAALAAATPAGAEEGGIEAPAVDVRAASTAAFQRRAAELQRGFYQSTLSLASAVTTRAEAGQCTELARQRARRYREILASALAEAGKADALAAEHPARAAALYRRAERIAGGVVAGAAAIGCEAQG